MSKNSKEIFLGLLAIVALIFVGRYLLPSGYRWADSVANPWAYANARNESLTGEWAGMLNFSGQASRSFKLRLKRDEMRGRRRFVRFAQTGTFEGTAQVPDEVGRVLNYEVWGKTNRSGSEISINFRPINRQPESFKQTQWTQLRGSWQGATLTLKGTADLVLYTPQGATSTSTDAPLSLSAQLRKVQ